MNFAPVRCCERGLCGKLIPTATPRRSRVPLAAEELILDCSKISAASAGRRRPPRRLFPPPNRKDFCSGGPEKVGAADQTVQCGPSVAPVLFKN